MFVLAIFYNFHVPKEQLAIKSYKFASKINQIFPVRWNFFLVSVKKSFTIYNFFVLSEDRTFCYEIHKKISYIVDSFSGKCFRI